MTLALAACATALPQPDEAAVLRAQVLAPEMTSDDLVRGRALYVSRCGRCHELYQPRTRDAASWRFEVDIMRERSGIDHAEARQVAAYLAAFAAKP